MNARTSLRNAFDERMPPPTHSGHRLRRARHPLHRPRAGPARSGPRPRRSTAQRIRPRVRLGGAHHVERERRDRARQRTGCRGARRERQRVAEICRALPRRREHQHLLRPRATRPAAARPAPPTSRSCPCRAPHHDGRHVGRKLDDRPLQRHPGRAAAATGSPREVMPSTLPAPSDTAPRTGRGAWPAALPTRPRPHRPCRRVAVSPRVWGPLRKGSHPVEIRIGITNTGRELSFDTSEIGGRPRRSLSPARLDSGVHPPHLHRRQGQPVPRPHRHPRLHRDGRRGVASRGVRGLTFC